jgi:hypothetical protein
MNTSRRTKIVLIFGAIVIIGYSIVLFSQSRNGIPQDFANARTQGSAIALTIVNLSNQSTDNLQQINQLDKEGNYTQALAMTTNLVTQSEQLRSQAVELSNQVGAMTKALASVNNTDARQAALESIASRLALIDQLINYSDDLQKLLITLQNHFTGKSIQPGDVAALVNQINTDVTAINNFNAQATQAMSQFDSIMAKQ